MTIEKKYKCIIGIIAVAALFFAVYGIAGVQKPELYMKVIPSIPRNPLEVYNDDDESERRHNKKIIDSLLPDLRGIDFEEQYNFSGSQFQLSMDCLSGQADVIIVDDPMFKQLVELHYTMNLDGYAEKFGVTPANKLGFFKKGGRKDGIHLFGISLDNSRTAKEICRDFNHRIAVIFKGTKHEYNSVRLIDALLEN